MTVCDALTMQALQRVGRWIIRHERPRPKLWAGTGRPLHEAYLRWPVDDAVIGKALRGAWDIVPMLLARWDDFACLDEEELMNSLDSYVHDVVVTQTPHTVAELRRRIDSTFPVLP